MWNFFSRYILIFLKYHGRTQRFYFRNYSHWLLSMCLDVVNLGNWLSFIVALMQDVSSSLFESSTGGIAYHKKISLNVFKN